MIENFSDNLIGIGKKYGNMVLLHAGLAEGLRNFLSVYGERSFNFGMGEENMVGASLGFAARGKVPVLVGDADTIVGKGLDQIRKGICIPNLNVKIIGVGQECNGLKLFDSWDVEVMRGLPNMRIFCPRDCKELLAAMEEMMGGWGGGYMAI